MTATTRVRAGAAVAAAALLLTGCSSGDEEREPSLEERITFEEVALPESLVSTSRRVGQWSTVPQSGDRPRLAVTTVAHGRADEANVSIWEASGVDALTEQAEVPVPGDVGTARVGSDAALTAIAGSSAVDGMLRTFLLTSTDRTTWEAVDLDEEVTALAASHVAVSDGRVYLLGAGATGHVPRVVVLDTATGDTAITILPAPTDGEALAVSGLSAVGDRVLAITAVGPGGDVTAPRAHVSEDHGASFDTVEMGPDTFGISGVVAAGDTFVATGSVRTAGYTKPASWSSADGRSWAVDDIVSLWEWDPDRWASERADVWFTEPTYDPEGATVAAAMLNEASLRVGVARRDAAGSWGGVLYSPSLGFDPWALPMQLGDRIALLSSVNGGSAAEVIVDVETTADRKETQLVSYATEPDGLAFADLGDRLGVAASTTAHIEEPDTWRVVSRSTLLTFSPTEGLVPSAWGPEDLPEESRPIVVTDARTGRSTLVTSHWSGDRFVTATWSRNDDGVWERGRTIDAAPGQVPTALAATEDGWLLALRADHEPAGTLVRRAEMWASPDGKEWTRQDGELSFPDGQGSVVHAICESPLGPVAVGSMDDAEGHARATAWRWADDAWAPSVLADAIAGSRLDSCVSDDDGVMVFGSDGAASRSWTSADLSTFSGVHALGEGLHRGAVVPLADGYAAGGTVRTETYVGPVLWLSADAREWSWVPLPVSTSSGTAPVVAESGSDLLVLHPGLLRAWRVPDVTALLAPAE
ncbi:hypothetical protein M3148_10270 [Georgenia satyanarayanai]|uniref:hypothetical protein n=1 Tax=Georgenia satyanarayanai TaxID=860221 RepID=UPI002041D95D|nr:hypothetical protein [Georgenia satyanarayanai]MCM3661366.1 hypothetical protein [Georgenia satyanarayanai]